VAGKQEPFETEIGHDLDEHRDISRFEPVAVGALRP
jgi:hypothetical protein